MEVESLGNLQEFTLTTSDILHNIKYDELLIIFKSFILLTLIRFLLTQTYLNRKLKFDGLFYRLINKYDIAREDKKEKWCETLWISIWHITSLTICSIILFTDVCKYDTINFGRKHFLNPNGLWFLYDDINQINGLKWPYIRVDDLFRNFYLFSAGMWISFFCYSFTEVRRSDTLVLQCHHVVTSILIYVSHISRVHRPGIIVIFLHDIADVLLYSVKALYYSKRVNYTLVKCLYGLFAISHVLSRFIMMGYCFYLPLFRKINSDVPGIDYIFQIFLKTPVFMLIYGSVASLLVMNIYWLSMIIEMISFVKTI